MNKIRDLRDLQALKHISDSTNYFLEQTKDEFCRLTFTKTNAKLMTDELNNVDKIIRTLNIVKEKGLPLGEIDMIKQSENYEQYCIKYSWCKMKNASIQKTEEEFKILKEVLQ